MHDLGNELERLAPRPATRLDVGATWRRGRRLRLRRIALATTGAMTAVALVAGAGAEVASWRGPETVPAAPAPAERTEELRELERSLQERVDDLEARIAALKEIAADAGERKAAPRARRRSARARIAAVRQAERLLERELERVRAELSFPRPST
jgi:hypothetical protein